MKNKTYSASVKCLNCGWEGQLELPFGETVVRTNNHLFTITYRYRKCSQCGTEYIIPNTDYDNYLLK
jgi:hypothetical protein